MISRVLELLMGKDDLERVAASGDLGRLTAYLRTRRILILRSPRRILDPSEFTADDLLELLRQEAEELENDPFEPWVLDFDGTRRLPAFSSQKKVVAFSGAISKKLNRVFALGCAEVLLEDVIKSIEVDFIDLNRFSRKNWEIGIGALGRDKA